MELPVAPQSYSTSPDTLVRAIIRADVTLARMAAQEIQLESSTIFTNPQRPSIHMCNFAADVRMEAERTAEQALDEIDNHFESAGCRCRMLISNEPQWGQPLAEAATARKYQRQTADVCLLSNYTLPATLNDAVQVIPGRAAYKQLQAFRQQAAMEQHSGDTSLAEAIAAMYIDHLDEARLEVFLGRIDGEAVGLVNLLTLGQIGVIEWMYTRQETRRRGVARTLLTHAIDHCHRAMFEQVILKVPQDATAMRLYEELGFKPVATLMQFVR